MVCSSLVAALTGMAVCLVFAFLLLLGMNVTACCAPGCGGNKGCFSCMQVAFGGYFLAVGLAGGSIGGIVMLAQLGSYLPGWAMGTCVGGYFGFLILGTWYCMSSFRFKDVDDQTKAEAQGACVSVSVAVSVSVSVYVRVYYAHLLTPVPSFTPGLGFWFCGGMVVQLIFPWQTCQNREDRKGTGDNKTNLLAEGDMESNADRQWSADAQPKVARSCPGNHGLVPFAVPQEGYYCDGCNATVPEGAVMSGCRVCDFDMCSQCTSR